MAFKGLLSQAEKDELVGLTVSPLESLALRQVQLQESAQVPQIINHPEIYPPLWHPTLTPFVFPNENCLGAIISLHTPFPPVSTE